MKTLSAVRLAAMSLAVQHLVATDNVPHRPFDKNTISTCTQWFDNWGQANCTYVRDFLLCHQPGNL